MPSRRVSPTQRLHRLATAARQLEDRRDRVESLRDHIEVLGQADVAVVDGQRVVITALLSVLTDARAALVDLEAEGADLEALERLERLVGPGSWDALDPVEEVVTHTEQLVEEARQDVRTTLQRWIVVRRTVEEIDAKLRERKAVLPTSLALGRDRLRSLVDQATAGLNDQQLLAAWVALEQLDAVPASTSRVNADGEPPEAPMPAAEVAAALQARLDEVVPLSGRVQLTVLRGELADDRLEYTFMLLAPGGDRRAGLNVQDSTTIVRQDRTWFLDVVGAVSGGAYRSMRDSRPADAQSEGPVVDHAEELRDMGCVLYKLLVPDRMKDELRAHARVPLSITTNDLQLPWELMFDDCIGDGGAFLAHERPVTRMPVGRARGRELRLGAPTGTGRRVALIASKGTPALPGAVAEVERIAERLGEDRNVEVVVLSSDRPGKEPTGARFREILLDGGFDVIHYAGHAAFDERETDQSGLLLEDGEVCFAQKIQRLLEGNPLVFVNACDSARLGDDSERRGGEGRYESDPSEGLASAFVYGGALACIGTMWPVDDTVAADFAIGFYRQLFAGQPLGAAMLAARKDVAARHPADPSSAAFVLYGEPSLQLANPSPSIP